MNEKPAPKAAGFARSLGHVFRDPSLLEEALTHRSAAQADPALSDNERLEFLGDRVLGLVIAERLLEIYPTEREGALAQRLARLVSRETLACVAAELDLGRFLRLAPGDERAGGRDNDTLLADACEAVIAALYLDGGLDAARGFIVNHWDAHLERPLGESRDAKTRLQEWAQARGLAVPDYREIGRTGPAHAPRFLIEVRAAEDLSARAEAGSKRKAEQAAAEILLEAIRKRKAQD